MKKLTLALVITLVGFLSSVAVHAEDKPKENKPSDKSCDCEKDKDGKTCGVDKDCCCTGEKATKPDTEKKPDSPKPKN